MALNSTHIQSHEDWLISKSLHSIMHTEDSVCLGLKIRFTKAIKPELSSVWREMQS